MSGVRRDFSASVTRYGSGRPTHSVAHCRIRAEMNEPVVETDLDEFVAASFPPPLQFGEDEVRPGSEPLTEPGVGRKATTGAHSVPASGPTVHTQIVLRILQSFPKVQRQVWNYVRGSLDRNPQ
jgi:hypothetical protein